MADQFDQRPGNVQVRQVRTACALELSRNICVSRGNIGAESVVSDVPV